MSAVIAYIMAAAAGAALAWALTVQVELRPLRWLQMALAPGGTMICFYGAHNGGMPGFIVFLVGLGFLIVLLAPNLSLLCGTGIVSFLENADWTPTEEEIALRPIRLLIDRENYRQALAALEALLPHHLPTYEAVLLQAKLLNHIGRVDEAEAALLALLPLCRDVTQQLSIMQMTESLEKFSATAPPPAITPGLRRVEIGHALVLFQITDTEPAPHREIPPGVYQVEQLIHRERRWLKMTGEPWGNAEPFWRAVPVVNGSAAAAPKTGVLWKIMGLHQAALKAMGGRSHREKRADAQQLFQEARACLEKDDWAGARPLLQRAVALQPDKYEYAYRWLQAVVRTSDAATADQILRQVLAQSQWSQSEQDMLNQLRK